MDPFFIFKSYEDRRREWEMDAALLSQQVELLKEMEEGELRPTKRRTINRDHAAANERLMADYFNEQCTYTDAQFRRRFRMRRTLFLRIVDALSNKFQYFTHRRNHARKLGLTPLQKCTVAMRMLAYRQAADACDEYLKVAGSTAIECVKNFCDGIIELFEKEYLRRPTATDLEMLLQVGEARGFPGMIGSIDCTHWTWPWHGQFTSGHKGTATVILEAVVSHDLWIWHAFFGMPGVLNDINVLDRSPVFNDIESGAVPQVQYTVNGTQYNLGYYLADGIYPKWLVFIQTIPMPQGGKAKFFSKVQESCRKDVERAFGVLKARFAIIRQPALMWDLEVLGKIMRACIILHNMIVEDERDAYSRGWEHENSEPSSNDASSSSTNNQNEVRASLERHVSGRTRASLRDRPQHTKLKTDLIEHIWNKFGTTKN